MSRLTANPLRELWHRPAGQLAALDALRTLAVAFVVFGHTTVAYVAAGGVENAYSRLPFVRGGWIGVDLFFVLSGYFIGRQLWRELDKTGTISFGQFFIRRGLRIWPLYFFFLAFVLLVLGRGGASWRGWSDAVFLTNYVNQGVVMGSWSLCTEEQFYILTPLLLIFTARRARSVASYRTGLVVLLIALPLVRLVTFWWLTGSVNARNPEAFRDYLYAPIHTHSDGLVMGLLLANLESYADSRYKTGLWASVWTIPFAMGLCVVLQRLHREALNFTGITLVFGAAVWYLLSKRPAWLSLLNWQGFYWFSRLSFGMYLNHEYIHEGLVQWGLMHLPLAGRLPAIHNLEAGLLVFLVSAALSLVTFCLIEHPFLLLREWVLAPGAKQAAGVGEAAVAAPSPAVSPLATAKEA
jgi:peptidoglycan/LPS O-acetylase OafA/YrhL